MQKTNLSIFDYSPKELTTDAFIKYLLLWSDQNNLNASIANKLLLKDEDQSGDITIVEVERQKSYGKKKADLVVNFNLNGNLEKVVFENKTTSTTSESQLNSYKKDGTYRYLYLKLGYINSREEALCSKYNYNTISAQYLYDIIKDYTSDDEIINQYVSHIYTKYVEFQSNLKSKYDDGSIVKELSNQDAQLYILDRLAKSFGTFEFNKKNLTFDKLNHHIQYSSNVGGNPWSQLVFIEKSEELPYALFWRIDKRLGRYYIRLSMYGNSKGKSKEARLRKKRHRKKFREDAKAFFNQKSGIKRGDLSNRGENEQEVVIFFFDENNLHALITEIPKFSSLIAKIYFGLFEAEKPKQ